MRPAGPLGDSTWSAGRGRTLLAEAIWAGFREEAASSFWV